MPTDSTMRESALESLIQTLEHVDDPFDLDAVTELVAAIEPDDAELEPHVLFRDGGRCRCPLHRSERFDVMLLCWKPGQWTDVHDHHGQRGWVRVLQGTLEEARYRLADGSARPEDGATGVELLEIGRARVPAGPTVATVDPVRAIHAVGNPREASENAVSLHVYSRPHDVCLSFDVAAGTCRRKQMSFDRRRGG